MSAGASLPYHLRPHKAVDRRIFVDLLSRVERWRPLNDYVYLSMGAYPLEDHKLVHRILGMRNLITFDYDDEVVARQVFNRPVASCHCLMKNSGEVVAQLDGLIAECGIEPEGVVVWLDYTDPKKLGTQVREFQTLLDKMGHGDIVRVTVNAHPNELADGLRTAVPVEEKRESQFTKLKRRIEDFLPSWVTAADMTAETLPRVLAESFSSAALAAIPATSNLVVSPLSIVRYADGQQMLSITAMLCERDQVSAMREQTGIDAWPFGSPNWSTVHNLIVPALTLREKLFLEREALGKSSADIAKELGFKTASDISIDEFLENYRMYYRFYPSILHADF